MNRRARGQTHAVPRQPVQRGVGWRSAGQRGPAPVIEIPDNPQDMVISIKYSYTLTIM